MIINTDVSGWVALLFESEVEAKVVKEILEDLLKNKEKKNENTETDS